MTSLKIAILGECMIELQQKGELLKRAFGGDTLNTATYLSRLTQQQAMQTSYVTALGFDPFSKDMLAQWQQESIDTSLILQIKEKQPGLYYIETDGTGERTFHYWRNDSAAKYLLDQPESVALLETLLSYDAIYLSGITLAILTDNGRKALLEFLKRFRFQDNKKVIFDNNYRPKLWASQSAAKDAYLKTLQLTDIALLTFDDDQALFGDDSIEDCIKRSQAAGIKEIVLKRGSDDCVIIENGKEIIKVPTKKVNNVVDTTAAGDSFSAGYLAERLNGRSAEESAKAAHIMAGAVIQHPGAIIPASAMPK